VAISGSSERVHDSAERLRELGVQTWSHQAGAGTHVGVEALWRFIESPGRPVDVAVLNVGIATGGAFADTPLEDHLKVLAVIVTGTTHMAKRVVDYMAANGNGRILIVSSVSATTPTPYEGVYGATKALGYSARHGREHTDRTHEEVPKEEVARLATKA
jgi:short-subunit dehydrogenase